MTAASTEADRFHRARVEFEEASAAGCTIVELRRRKVELRQRAQRAVADHTSDLMTGEPAQRAWSDWYAPHMMRD